MTAKAPRVRNREVKNIRRKNLLPDPLNWHTHPEAQRNALAAVFQEIGFVGHLLVRPAEKRNQYYIVDGHERAEHFQPGQMVPCCVLDIDDAEAKKLLLSYDPLGYLGGVDDDALARLQEQVEFATEGLDASIADSFDRLQESGDVAGSGGSGSGSGGAAELSEDPVDFNESAKLQKKYKTKAGQLWEIHSSDGKRCHRLLCGSSEKADDVDRVMGEQLADFTFTSPPYNVGKQYGKHNDRLGDPKYHQFIENVVGQCVAKIKPGRFLCWQIGVAPKVRPHWHAMALEKAGLTFWRRIVWNKAAPAFPMHYKFEQKPYARNYTPDYTHEEILATFVPVDGDPYRPDWSHEFVLTFTAGKPDVGEFVVPPAEDIRSDVWVVPIANVTKHTGDHPAPFPIKLVGAAIAVFTNQGETLFEPFAGAGTTFAAAEQLGRVCHGIELEPKYVALILERLTKLGCECRLAK